MNRSNFTLFIIVLVFSIALFLGLSYGQLIEHQLLKEDTGFAVLYGGDNISKNNLTEAIIGISIKEAMERNFNYERRIMLCM